MGFNSHEDLEKMLAAFRGEPREQVVKALRKSFLETRGTSETEGLAPILKTEGYIAPAEFMEIQKHAMTQGMPSEYDRIEFKQWDQVAQMLTAMTLMSWLSRVEDWELNQALDLNIRALDIFATEVRNGKF
jgi:hypothetical protein